MCHFTLLSIFIFIYIKRIYLYIKQESIPHDAAIFHEINNVFHTKRERVEREKYFE